MLLSTSERPKLSPCYRCYLRSLRLVAVNTSPDQISDAAGRLTWRINSWVNWQNSVYSTACQVELDPPPAVDTTHPDYHQLMLPSAITNVHLLEQMDKVSALRAIEFRLRQGVAEDGVREVRRQVSIRALFEGREVNDRAQQTRTRAQHSLLSAQNRVGDRTLHAWFII